MDPNEKWTHGKFKKKSKDKSQKEGTGGKEEARKREREKRGVEREKLLSKI